MLAHAEVAQNDELSTTQRLVASEPVMLPQQQLQHNSCTPGAPVVRISLGQKEEFQKRLEELRTSSRQRLEGLHRKHGDEMEALRVVYEKELDALQQHWSRSHVNHWSRPSAEGQ